MLNEIISLIKQIYKKHLGKEFPYTSEMLEDRNNQAQFWQEMELTYLDTKQLKEFMREGHST